MYSCVIFLGIWFSRIEIGMLTRVINTDSHPNMRPRLLQTLFGPIRSPNSQVSVLWRDVQRAGPDSFERWWRDRVRERRGKSSGWKVNGSLSINVTVSTFNEQQNDEYLILCREKVLSRPVQRGIVLIPGSLPYTWSWDFRSFWYNRYRTIKKKLAQVHLQRRTKKARGRVCAHFSRTIEWATRNYLKESWSSSSLMSVSYM